MPPTLSPPSAETHVAYTRKQLHPIHSSSINRKMRNSGWSGTPYITPSASYLTLSPDTPAPHRNIEVARPLPPHTFQTITHNLTPGCIVPHAGRQHTPDRRTAGPSGSLHHSNSWEYFIFSDYPPDLNHLPDQRLPTLLRQIPERMAHLLIRRAIENLEFLFTFRRQR